LYRRWQILSKKNSILKLNVDENTQTSENYTVVPSFDFLRGEQEDAIIILQSLSGYLMVS
jgi:hypothetical protein